MQTYCTLLSDQLQPAICRKVSFFNMTMIFTTQHTCQTVEKTEEMGWELLLYPQYSPDLAPSDFHLFGPLKESFAGIIENNEEDFQQNVRKFLYNANKDFYATGFS